MSARSIPPWHLWGNTIQIPLQTQIGTTTNTTTVQLVKASYKRPENWRFIFAGTWLFADTGIPLAGSTAIFLDFDLIIGTGRSQITLPAFEQFQWLGTDTVGPTSLKFSASVNGPVRTSPAPATLPQNVIDHFPAQDINIQARVVAVIGIASTGNLIVEASCNLAPNVHVRPDWYEHPPDFEGGEEKGR